MEGGGWAGARGTTTRFICVGAKTDGGEHGRRRSERNGDDVVVLVFALVDGRCVEGVLVSSCCLANKWRARTHARTSTAAGEHCWRASGGGERRPAAAGPPRAQRQKEHEQTTD